MSKGISLADFKTLCNEREFNKVHTKCYIDKTYEIDNVQNIERIIHNFEEHLPKVLSRPHGIYFINQDLPFGWTEGQNGGFVFSTDEICIFYSDKSLRARFVREGSYVIGKDVYKSLLHEYKHFTDKKDEGMSPEQLSSQEIGEKRAKYYADYQIYLIPWDN